MKARADIQAELEHFSKTVAELPLVQPYKVPDGYFEALPGQMLKLAQSLEEESAGDEITGLSPLLAGLSRKMPMTVPEGYFDLVKVPEDKPIPALAPVIPMKKNRFRLSAVAASVVVILGFGAILLKMNQGDNRNLANIGTQLPKVSETEMDDFLNGFPDLSIAEPFVMAGNPAEVEDMIREVDEQGLKEFLSDQPETMPTKLN